MALLFSPGVEAHDGLQKKKRFGPKRKKIADGKDGANSKDETEGDTTTTGERSESHGYLSH